MGEMIDNFTPANEWIGKKAVLAFIKVHKSNHTGCRYKMSVRGSKLDCVHHIDLTIVYPNNKVEYYDIKNNMAFNGNEDCFTFELQNNNGNLGSLYGRQDFFAVQQKEHDDLFWIIPRKQIADFIDNTVDDIFVEALKYATYKKYKRTHQNKDDVLTLIPLDDVLRLGILSQLILIENDRI